MWRITDILKNQQFATHRPASNGIVINLRVVRYLSISDGRYNSMRGDWREATRLVRNNGALGAKYAAALIATD